MNSSRIYTYKITFEEVPYYYYGVKREKIFNEDYWGSPITHKWMWEFYTPKKQILEFFDYDDEGWNKAQEVEKRIIKKFYNTDKWCLNENCGGFISINCLKEVGKKNKELGRGFFSLTPEERKIHQKNNGKKGALKNKLNSTAIYSLTPEQLSTNGKKGGHRIKELGVGLFGLSKEERIANAKLGGKCASSQKWQCLETGFITNAGNLTRYQKARNIDTSKRIKIL